MTAREAKLTMADDFDLEELLHLEQTFASSKSTPLLRF